MNDSAGRRVWLILAVVAAVLVAAPSSGAQTPICFGEPATIVAEPGVPTVGTDGDDVIVGTAGPDVIRGGGGDDRICGLGGADVISGNRGRDRINAGGGADRVFGGKGRDVIVGSSGPDVLKGNSGGDTIRGNKGRDVIRGGTGDDVIWGGAGGDTIFGNGGADQISGSKGNDWLSGGKHDDVLRGRRGLDILLGNKGDDDLDGGGPPWHDFDACIGGPGTNALARCETELPTALVATAERFFWEADLVVPADGRPLVGVLDDVPMGAVLQQQSLRFARCVDATCSAVTESTVELIPPDGWPPQMLLGPDGLPVAAFYQRSDVASLLVCEDPGCVTFSETVIEDVSPSMTAAIGDDGTTYVASDGSDREFRVFICEDPTCPGGETMVEVEGSSLSAEAPEIAVGADGLPFVAVASPKDLELNVVECLDPGCVATKETVLDDEFLWPGGPWPRTWSAAAGPAGPSAVASLSMPATSGGELVLHVWDDSPKAATRLVLDTGLSSGSGTATPPVVSVAPDGRPYVVWSAEVDDPGTPHPAEFPVDLKVASCEDRTCASGTIATVARSRGQWPFGQPRFAFAPDGRPVLSMAVKSLDVPTLPSQHSAAVVVRCRDQACVAGALAVERWDGS